MHLLHSIRRWLWRVRLNLIQLEIVDVLDDMAGALEENNLGVYRALADFHTELVTEAQLLRAQIKSLTTY